MSTAKGSVLKVRKRRHPDKNSRPLDLIHNQAGITIMEVVIVIGLFGFLAFFSMVSMAPLFGLGDRVNQAVSDDLDLTIGLQSLRSQLSRSSITRTPLVTCSLPAPLSASSSTATTEVLPGSSSFTIPYNDLRSLGAIEASSTERLIKVGQIGGYMAGQILHVRTLNAQNLEGLYVIRSIAAAQSRLVVEPLSSQPPSTFGCTLQRPGSVTNLIFPASGATAQVAISRLRFAAYRIDKSKALNVTVWPTGKNLSDTRTDLVRNGVDRIHFSQKFTASSDNKGDYQARITADVASTDGKKIINANQESKRERITMETEYILAGLDVQNELALPEPPSVESISLSCSLGVNVVRDIYVPDGHAYPVSVYQLEMVPSDNGLIGSSSAPQAIVTLSTVDDPAIPKPRCWRESEVTSLPSSRGLLMRLIGPGSESGTSLGRPTSATSTLPLEKVFCTIQGAAKLQSSMKFLLSSGGWLQWKTINCTPTHVEGTGSEKWVYDLGMESACNRDGSIFIGRLLKESNATQTGPELSAKANGCVWSGSSSTSCNAAQVLNSSPSAELRSVQLVPDDLQLNITTNYPTLNCN